MFVLIRPKWFRWASHNQTRKLPYAYECVCVFVQKLIAHTLALICVYDGIHLKTYGLCSPRGALHFILYTFPKPFVGAPRLGS